MKPVSYKRVLAYIIDTLIVTIIVSLITMFIPASEEYTKKANELDNVIENYGEGKITEEEYLERINDINYVISKETISTSVITIIITTIYFVVVTYYMNGQTLGKKMMNLQIVSIDKKKLTMNNYLVRSFIVNSIFMNVIGVLTILFMSKTLYLQVNDIVSTIFGGLYVLIFAMILFREDGRGLHDLIARTKVINIPLKDKAIPEIEIVKEEKIEAKKEKVIKQEENKKENSSIKKSPKTDNKVVTKHQKVTKNTTNNKAKKTSNQNKNSTNTKTQKNTRKVPTTKNNKTNSKSISKKTSNNTKNSKNNSQKEK